MNIKPFVFLFWWMKLQFAPSHYVAHLIHLSLPLFNSWINAASNKGLEIEKICHGRMLKSHPHIVTQKQDYWRAYSAHHPHQLFSVVILQMYLCPLADITKQKKNPSSQTIILLETLMPPALPPSQSELQWNGAENGTGYLGQLWQLS